MAWRFNNRQRPWETREQYLKKWRCEVVLGADYATGFGPGVNPRWRRRRIAPERIAAIIRERGPALLKQWLDSRSPLPSIRLEEGEGIEPSSPFLGIRVSTTAR